MVQVSQSLACAALHRIFQRCCCWLLLAHDRVQADQFSMTQEYLANMLAIRRSSVTEVAGFLQKKGLICHVRGKVTILDRAGLERAACECYGIIRGEYDRLP